jgi:glycosyltransferase involved in cell wall biosynthesis
MVYTRLPQAAAIASGIGIPTVYEVHDLPHGTIAPWLLARFLKGRGAQALVVITDALRKKLASKYSLPKSLPVLVAPDGVDLSRYRDFPSPKEARKSISSELDIPNGAFVAGYTGHLYPGRGIGLIIEIAEQLPDVYFLLAGGEIDDVKRIRKIVKSRGLENVTLAGFIPNAELPRYQAACEVLLMPYQRRVAASSGGNIARYLSPMKLFEYLACGRVILSSNLPVLQEILNSSNAVLLPSDDPPAWVDAIQDLRANPEKRAQFGACARRDAQLYSWENRAQNILSIIETKSSSANL